MHPCLLPTWLLLMVVEVAPLLSWAWRLSEIGTQSMTICDCFWCGHLHIASCTRVTVLGVQAPVSCVEPPELLQVLQQQKLSSMCARSSAGAEAETVPVSPACTR